MRNLKHLNIENFDHKRIEIRKKRECRKFFIRKQIYRAQKKKKKKKRKTKENFISILFHPIKIKSVSRDRNDKVHETNFKVVSLTRQKMERLNETRDYDRR